MHSRTRLGQRHSPAPPMLSAKLTPMLQLEKRTLPAPTTLTAGSQAGRRAGRGSQGSGGEGEGSAGLRYMGTLPEQSCWVCSELCRHSPQRCRLGHQRSTPAG